MELSPKFIWYTMIQTFHHFFNYQIGEKDNEALEPIIQALKHVEDPGMYGKYSCQPSESIQTNVWHKAHINCWTQKYNSITSGQSIELRNFSPSYCIGIVSQINLRQNTELRQNNSLNLIYWATWCVS